MPATVCEIQVRPVGATAENIRLYPVVRSWSEDDTFPNRAQVQSGVFFGPNQFWIGTYTGSNVTNTYVRSRVVNV